MALSAVHELTGCVENAEHGDGVTLLGGWVRLPAAALAGGGVKLRLTASGGLRQEWKLGRLMTRRDLPAQGGAPTGRGFQLLLRGLPDWTGGSLTVLHPGGEIALHPPAITPEPFRPRGALDGADAQEAWGWLVHAPGTEAFIEMEGMGRLPVRCDIHRADLPFDDGSPLPAFGFHLRFAGTALADGQGPRRVVLRAAGVALGEVLVGARAPAAQPSAPDAPRAAMPGSRVSGLLVERPAVARPLAPPTLASPTLASPTLAPHPAPRAPIPPSVPQTIRLVLEACHAVGDGQLLLGGWVDCGAGAGPPLLALDPPAPGAPGPAVALFDPPEGSPPGRRRQGFLMAAAQPPRHTTPSLRVEAGGQVATLPLPGDAHGPAPDALLHGADGGAVFALLRAAAAGGPAAALLAPGLGPAGAFSRWVAGLPLLEPADFARVEAWAAASGECGLVLTLDPPVGPDTALDLLGLVPEGGRVRAVTVTQSPPLTSETMLLTQGTLLDLKDLPAPSFELVMQLRHAGEGQWFRVNPRPLPAPLLLDALHRHAALPEGPGLAETLDWLRALLDRRTGVFAGRLRPAAPPPRPGPRPLLLALHGLDDPYTARLLAMAAPAIEARADAVMLLGPRPFTEPAAELFLERGRIAVHGGAGLGALRGPARRGLDPGAGLVILDMLELAAALEAETLDAALAPRLSVGALPLLERLAVVAGLPEAADAAARLAAMTGGASPPPGIAPLDGAAARLVAAHLEQLWRGLAPLFLVEAPDDAG